MSLNWTGLVSQGRAKDIGIAWTPEELDLLLAIESAGHGRQVAAGLIREGVSSLEEAEKALKGGKSPRTRKELEADAKEAGVEFAPEAPDTVLEKEVKRTKSKK